MGGLSQPNTVLTKKPDTHLIIDSSDIADALIVARKLGNVSHQPLDDLQMTFTEGSHQATDSSVVLAVYIGSVGHQQLNNIQVAS